MCWYRDRCVRCAYVQLDSTRASGILILYFYPETNNGMISCGDSSGPSSIVEYPPSLRHGVIPHRRSSASLSLLCFSLQVFYSSEFQPRVQPYDIVFYLLQLGPTFSWFEWETCLENHCTSLRSFCLFCASKVIFRKVWRKSKTRRRRRRENFAVLAWGRGGVNQNLKNRTIPNGAGGGRWREFFGRISERNTWMTPKLYQKFFRL